jgi:XTP/dITP diphosphohydrolase
VRQVVLATHNQHKIDEVTRILAGAGADIDVLALPADAPEVVESGATFAANAMLKARSAAAHTGLVSIADDSGLCVDALNGMPGVLSARWAGAHGDDVANLSLLLAQLVDVAPVRRGAQFVCAAAVVDPRSGDERVVEGVLEGRIGTEVRGVNGFGYDPIFIPDGVEWTTAQLQPGEKDAMSHRGSAFRALAALVVP